METTPSCNKFRLLADEYIEGELTAAEMREFEAHLAECEECRKELEELRALKEAIRAAKEEMPNGLHSRIMASIEAEPKKAPRHKFAFFRSAAISVACVMLCLSATLAITMIPMWRSGSGAGTPNDPQYSLDNTVAEECITEPKPESALSKPEDGNIEAEQTFEAVVDPAPEVAPADTSPIPETIASEMTAVDETEAVMQAPIEEAVDTMLAVDADTKVSIRFEQPAAESSSAPGGEEITLALLIVSGLLAVASFIAFLISLSSIRNKPTNKGDQK
jgi:predicted anti-sigma-YlaC factor YlaD